jgi:anti-sigma-K factor RskA
MAQETEPEDERGSLRKAGSSAWRATVLAGAGVIVVALFVGMAYLVYLGQMSDGPLILFVGVVLGYLMRSVVRYL